MTQQVISNWKPSQDEVNAQIKRHTSEIDHAHSRLRYLQTECDVVKSKITEIDDKLIIIETRNHQIEQRLQEDHEMVNDLKHQVSLIRHSSDSILDLSTRTMISAEQVYGLLQKHINDENTQFSDQTKRIELLSRRLIGFVTAISAVVLVLLAIYQHITGVGLIESILKLISLTGAL